MLPQKLNPVPFVFILFLLFFSVLFMVLPTLFHPEWQTIQIAEGQTLTISADCHPSAMEVHVVAIIPQNTVATTLDGQRYNFSHSGDLERAGCPMVYFAGVNAAKDGHTSEFWLPKSSRYILSHEKKGITQ